MEVTGQPYALAVFLPFYQKRHSCTHCRLGSSASPGVLRKKPSLAFADILILDRPVASFSLCLCNTTAPLEPRLSLFLRFLDHTHTHTHTHTYTQPVGLPCTSDQFVA